jgi:hypothetical protein
MVHPYLRRRQRLEPVTYKHPLLKSALQETLGVILFQEQILKVAKALAGFTHGQGEQLRRVLGRNTPIRRSRSCTMPLWPAHRRRVYQYRSPIRCSTSYAPSEAMPSLRAIPPRSR